MRALRLPHAAAPALLAVGSAQGTDAITFVRMVRDHGIAAEANPVVAQLAAMGDIGALVLLKALLVAEVVAVFAIVSRRHPALGALIATVAVVAGLVGAWTNVAVIAGGALPVGLLPL
jgi:type III secretion system FlhB-like substrate exporter